LAALLSFGKTLGRDQPARMIVVRLRFRGSRAGETRDVQIAEDGDSLYMLVAAELEMEAGSFSLLHGFPPIALDDQGKTARELGIRNGDVLILMETEKEAGIVQGQGGMRQPKRRRVDAKTKALPKNKEGMSIKLLDAFTPGQGNDAVSSFLRLSARAYVIKQYEIRAANDRLKAALGQTYKVQFLESDESVASAHGGRLAKVTFSTGSRGKTSVEEIKIMTQAGMQSMIQYLLAANDEQLETVQEHLRPNELCRVSPTMFWSLVEFCREKNYRDRKDVIDLDFGIQQVHPEADWSFLQSRRRNLSEKAAQAAKAAQAQQQDKEQRKQQAEERKRKREASNDGAQDDQENPDDPASHDSRLILEAFSSVPQAEMVLEQINSKYGCKSLVDLASLDQNAVVETGKIADASLDEDTLRECHGAAREAAAHHLVWHIVKDRALVDSLKDKDIARTVFDLVRFRVPGRIDAYASGLGLNKDVLKGWQEAAQALVGQYSWLQNYRTVG